MGNGWAMGNPVSGTKSRPGRIWYVIPLLLAVASLVPVPLAIWNVAQDKSVLAVEFIIPGQKEFEIQTPGKYVLWNESATIFAGQTFSSSAALPGGMHIQLLELKTMAPVPMTPDLSTTFTSGSTARNSVGTFEITNPGKYRISVDGQFPQRVFYFRESMMRQARVILRAVILMVSGLLGAVLLWIAIFLVRRFSSPGH